MRGEPRPEATVVAAFGLLTSVVHDLALGTARDTHRAIAVRAHRGIRRGVGPIAGPVEAVQLAITAGVYGSIGVGLRAAGHGLDQLARAGVGPRLDAGPRGRFVTAAVNGVLGDELSRTDSPLTVDLAVRRDGRDVPLSERGLDHGFPDATNRLVVFLHGLCENETHWNRHRKTHGTTYADALASDGWTPVFLRLNTGLPVRENGIQLAVLLDQLVAAWPVPIERIALVGHSMGGLVARAATDAPGEWGWTEQVTDVVTLGTPHLGSPVAKAAASGSALLSLTPESAAFSTLILERRSAGIRDLADGLAFDVPPLAHAHYRVVAATVTESTTHPVGTLVGDFLVRPGSAHGRDASGRDLFPGSERLVVGRADHLGLLNHPDVLTALARWLA